MNTCYFSEKTLNLAKVKDLLEKGSVIAFPTETVYGLGALISQINAIEEIYKLKKRANSKALTVHAGKIEDVDLVAADIPDDFYILAKKFLPGPLTIILKKNNKIPSVISPYETVGFRVPSHLLTLKLLSVLDEPLVATSANISSMESSLSFEEVLATFDGKIPCIIDGGKCSIGIASTIVSLEGEIKILRKGLITQEQIEEALGKKISS